MTRRCSVNTENSRGPGTYHFGLSMFIGVLSLALEPLPSDYWQHFASPSQSFDVTSVPCEKPLRMLLLHFPKQPLAG
jgi:hypothetical protein